MEIPSYAKLPETVVLVTEARGREVFSEVRPLFIRLRDLIQGGALIHQIGIGPKTLTETSKETLIWYLENLSFAGLGQAMRKGGRDPGPLYTKMAWEAFLKLLAVEFLQP